MDKTSIPWKELPDSDKEHHCKLYNRQDEKGLNYFFDHLYTDLFKYAYKKIKDLAESTDIVQQSYIDVWYAKDRPEFDNANKLRNYHFAAVRNKCITLLDKLGKYRSDDFDDEMPDDSASYLFEKTEDRELYNLALKKIRQLPEPQRGIALAKLQGMKYKEIAEALNLSENRVGTILSRLWQRLKRELAEYR